MPSVTTGRVRICASCGTSRDSPKAASTTSAAMRPYSLARTAHAPPADARAATEVNISAIPASIGSLPRRNGWLVRLRTKGRTGRMHGLRMVSTPPR
ncbi:hypothetical protein D9M69_723960 [compost metagenome]